MVRDAPSLILDPLVHSPTPTTVAAPSPKQCQRRLPVTGPDSMKSALGRLAHRTRALGGAGTGRSLAGGRGSSGEPTHVRRPESQSAGQLLSWGGENEGFLPVLGLRLRICAAGWRTLDLLRPTFPPSARRPSVCGSLGLLVRGDGGHRTDFTHGSAPGNMGPGAV